MTDTRISRNIEQLGTGVLQKPGAAAWRIGYRAGLLRAEEMAVEQAKIFRDEAHDQKQLGNREMHKRALSIATFFEQHGIALRFEAEKKQKAP